MSTLYYYHDPMCSWCWAYRPTAKALFAALPATVERVDILGGLAADSDTPMPLAQRQQIAGYWCKIQDMLGTEFNFEFWERCVPRRSTYPACRAVLAADRQGRYGDMVFAIQKAYYLRALNPSDLDVLETLAGELGLDEKRFAADLRSPEVNDELAKQIHFAHSSPISGFPSLVLEHAGAWHPVEVDYRCHEGTLGVVERHVAATNSL